MFKVIFAGLLVLSVIGCNGVAYVDDGPLEPVYVYNGGVRGYYHGGMFYHGTLRVEHHHYYRNYRNYRR